MENFEGFSQRTPLPALPTIAGERLMLESFLDHQRAIVRRKVEGLSDDQLRARLFGHPSPLTVGGILKHLAWVEVKWSRIVFLGLPFSKVGHPWTTMRGTDPEWEWDVSDDTGSYLLSLHLEAVNISRAIYAEVPTLTVLSRRAGCEDPEEPPQKGEQTYELRWIYAHLLEEYARHAGHLDLLRENIDGVTGD